MKLKYDPKDPSTLRGGIWLIAGCIGTILAFLGKDPVPVATFTMAVCGGLGLVTTNGKKDDEEE